MKHRILFFNNTCNDRQQEICENMISVLHTMPVEVHFCNSDVDLLHIGYDVAMVCNKRGYSEFKKSGLDIPLLYVLSSEDFCNEMIFDSSFYTHILMINTNGTVYSNSFVTQSSFPFVAGKILPSVRGKKYHKLLVDIRNDDSLIGLLPLLNVYVDYEISILISKPNRFKDVVNSHIQLLSEKNRENLIEEADIFIAQGYTALKGVMQQKPVFVLGEYGFGGLVEKDNVREQYRTGFSGRLGGVQNEYLPLPMIDYEIKKVLNGEISGWKETAEVLCECCRETSDRFCQLVSFFANLSRQKGEVFLQKNHYMDYIEGDEANYWVVDKVYRKLLFEVDGKEKRLVDCFDSPRQLSSVSKEMKNDIADEEIKKMVDELLKYKLLDYCIYETSGTEL